MDTKQNISWTQEQGVNYEVASEILSGIIGFRLKWLREEKSKDNPDPNRIQELWTEIQDLDKLQNTLNLKDDRTNAMIRKKYGREFRELMKDI